MKDNKLNYKIINLTAIMLLLYITVTNIGTWIGTLGKVIEVILPFIIAFTIAYALEPVVSWMKEKGLPEWLSVLLVVLLFVFILGFVIVTTLPLIYDQLQLLSKNLPTVLDNIADKFDLNLVGVEGSINNIVKDITTNVGNIVSTGVTKSVGLIGNFIVCFVATIYFLAYMDNIRASFSEFLIRTNKKIYKYVKSLDNELGNYIKGLMIFMIIEFLEYSILFRIVNHPWISICTCAQ